MLALSIIIPIYNVEKYLEECLDSIQAQTYNNFQAILVNDGSTDGSGKIANLYAKKDSRFIVIHQENKGLGAARNTGLEYIFSSQNTQNTAYIGLVDSDDVIAKDYYSNLIYCLEKNNALIAKSRNICVFHDDHYNKEIFEKEEKKEKGIMRRVTSKNLTDKIDPWRSVFCASLLKDLRFPAVRFAEDVPFGVCANVLAKNIALTKSAIYFYRLRQNSLTKKTHPPQEFFNAFAFIYNFFKEHDLLQTYILPTHILRPSQSYEYLAKDSNYLFLLQDFIRSLDIESSVLVKNKVLDAALKAKTLEEFLSNTQTFKEWRRKNFRISLNKKHKIITLFGKTLYNH
ncbi:glycosyltransferase family 2 protein [Helicobacter trogontum]|uniref:glycosyltransferase family 2 protein n=1 Tax=Helicobacter trogontum TaxID=50960 RepID=UPI000CF0E9D1|nr:glycosyltransferase [Helicobacter trogontum]